MSIIQWVMLLVVFLLLFNKKASNAACVICITYLMYELLVVGLGGVYYYSVSAALNVAAGYALYNVNKKAAICSYALVICNLIGYIMWVNYLSPSLYNSMSLSVLTVQILMILPKGLINGFGNSIKRLVSSCNVAFSFKANTKSGEGLQNKKAIK